MEKIWLNFYEQGIPAQINPDFYKSLVELFLDSCSKFEQETAYIHLGSKISYAKLKLTAIHFASFLQNEYKLKPGDRIILMLPNLLNYPVCLFGALLAGLTVVNVNPMYTASELELIIKDSGAKAIVILENIAKVLQKIELQDIHNYVVLTSVGDMHVLIKSYFINFSLRYVKKMIPKLDINCKFIRFSRSLSIGKAKTFTQPTVASSDLAFLQYTGGTTGTPKAAMLTHRNMVANIEQARVWIEKHFTNNKTILTALPLYHIFSLMANCLLFMRLGGTNILITDPRNINDLIKQLKKYDFAAITGVDTLFNALLSHPDFSSIDFSSLKLALGGGMPLHESVALKWQQLTKIPLIEAYGLTECSPAVCINPLSIKGYNHSIGVPIPSTQIDIRSENNQTVAINEPGELYVKGPQVMQGYWNNELETAEILQNGWLKTGDIVQMNEQGFVKIVDRVKDMILVSGFNVYPKEIEMVIAKHPMVLEVAVVGVPHAIKGEAVKAFIVKKDRKLSKEAIQSHCAKSLTAYKIPHQIEFLDSLPKSLVGKILKTMLRTQ